MSLDPNGNAHCTEAPSNDCPHVMGAPHAALEAGDLSCSICLDLLYKPCVNSCGHAFCFWCFHHAMDVFKTHHSCPLCRADFRHFPAVCVPLQRYLAHNFPKETAMREEEVRKLEIEEYKAESPSIEMDDDAGGNFNVTAAFACQKCSNLAVPPTVLSCGHVVCGDSSSRNASNAWNGVCPLDGCVGKNVNEQNGPAVCALMEKILRRSLSAKEYEASSLRSQRCRRRISTDLNKSTCDAGEQSSGVKSKTDELVPGDLVTIVGLTSARGAQLNGCEARIESYDSTSDRHILCLRNSRSEAAESSSTIAIKGENLRRTEVSSTDNDNFVHYGVGCDGCGIYPISGRRYKCIDCSEEIGFDLCGDCFDAGVHKKDRDRAGRFNQQHRPEHYMGEVVQDRTFFHALQEANPDVPLSELLRIYGL